MKFFIDTANIDEIREAASLGIIDGATTNPTLLSREKDRGKTYRDILLEICDIVKGPVSAEVVSSDAEGMLKEGRELRKLSDFINIKVPISLEGLKAVSALSSEGIPSNVTLIFSGNQALMAAKAGAAFISPFVGRIDDAGGVGMEIIDDIVQIYRNYDIQTQVIVASVRHPVHVLDAARIGADIATIPFKVIQKLVYHPLTDVGIQRFLDDWNKVSK
jgi:transaldolase